MYFGGLVLLSSRLRCWYHPSKQLHKRVTYRFLSTKSKGPSHEKVRAIPFTQHVKAADNVSFFVLILLPPLFRLRLE